MHTNISTYTHTHTHTRTPYPPPTHPTHPPPTNIKPTLSPTHPNPYQVLPLEDARALDKAAEIFHLTLLRDFMLRPTMEEANLTSLSSLIFLNR